MSDTQVICAEAPVALAIAPWGNIYPLTTCCQASAKGSEDGIVCRACYAYIDEMYGAGWELDDDRFGWSVYRVLVSDALADAGQSLDRVEEIVAYAREKAAAIINGETK